MIDGLPTTTRLRVSDLDMRGGSRYEDRTSNTYQLVGGAQYEGDGWNASLEGAYSSSRQHLDNLNIADIATGDAEFISNPGDKLWSMVYYNGFDQARLDPKSYRVASLNGPLNRISSDRLWDIKGDFRRDFSDEGLTTLRFGFHYTDRKIYQDNSRLTVQAAGVSALYGGLPAGPIPASFSAAPFMTLIQAGKGRYLGSYSGDAIFASEWLSSDTPSFISHFTDEQLIAASPNSLTNDPTGITDVKEKVFAAYARGDFVFGDLSGNVGFRVAHTRQATVGVSPDLNGITVQPDAGNITRVPASAPVTVSRDYWDFLPSFNLKWQPTDELLFRFSAARTITRPNLSNISPTTTANGVNLTVTQNNPYLDPFRANNLDATAEWYFSKDGLIGASFFYKNLKSLIRQETTVQPFTVTKLFSDGRQERAAVDFTVSQLVNGRGVTVKGFELYYQQAFSFLPAPFDGLGTVLNYTFIDNSDPTQLTAASRNNFNATGYYEKGPIGVRLSYSWRSGFLSTAATTPAMSQYTKAYGTLDGSINVKVNDRISLVLEAVNLLDTDERVSFTNGLPRRPNIVLILLDDFGIGDSRSYNPWSAIPTPNIDRLAREGMRFTDMHSSSAVCTPSRYSILTGRYCSRSRLKSGVLDGNGTNLIEPGRLTLPGLLKTAGYHTSGVGKWHLGLGEGEAADYAKPLRPGPIDHGFDYYFGIPSSLDFPSYLYFENDRVVEAPNAHTGGSDKPRGVFWRAGAIAPGFRMEKVVPTLTDKAVEVVRTAPKDRPFFLYFPLPSPHTPWVPLPEYRGKSGAGDYGDYVVETDAMIGRLLGAIEERGLAQDTIVIVTSDNGADWKPEDAARFAHRANAQWRGEKADAWEAGHRIPFVIRWPGRVAPGSTSAETGSLTDIMATLAGALGLPLPDDAAEDSFNLLPALQQNGHASIRPNIVDHSLQGLFTIREGNWKLIQGLGSGGFTLPKSADPAPGGPRGQLYDLDADPREENNLYDKRPDIVARLSATLDALQRDGRSRPRRSA